MAKGFYYWRSEFRLNSQELQSLQRLQITKLYIKFFDVIWDKQLNNPKPVSVVRFSSKVPEGVALIPSIYITNETLLNLPDTKIPLLADNLHQKYRQLLAASLAQNPPEIQIDCDWTEQTETKYFKLLSHLKQKFNRPTILSATIRLHQIKYKNRTGVPPVDRGIIMFYNLNHPGTPGVKNAILDLDVGKQYLDNLQEYPLPLDVALPIYSWGVLFQGKNYLGLVNNLTTKELQHNPNFLYNKQSGLFTAKQNTYILQTHIYKNDQLRIDEISYQELIKTGKYLAKRLPKQQLTVNLFHLDAKLIGRFTDEELQNVFHAFN